MPRESRVRKDVMVGVDLGGTKVLAAVLGAAGEILARHKTPTRADQGVDGVIDRIVESVETAIRDSCVSRESLCAVGVGCPGPLNPDTGVVEIAPNMPGWKDVPLKTILETRLGLRVYLGNDVDLGVYGEYRLGAGVGARNLVGIFIGTGIGGGLILDGRLYQGYAKMTGEVGHMVVQMDGPACACGRRGCFEALAGRAAVIRRIGELAAKRKGGSLVLEMAGGDAGAIRSSHLARAWQADDPPVRQALEEMAECTGIVVANLMHLLNPELFILGGGLMEALGGALLPLIEKTARREAFPNASRNVRIRPAMLGDDAGVVGAAFLARERYQAANAL